MTSNEVQQQFIEGDLLEDFFRSVKGQVEETRISSESALELLEQGNEAMKSMASLTQEAGHIYSNAATSTALITQQINELGRSSRGNLHQIQQVYAATLSKFRADFKNNQEQLLDAYEVAKASFEAYLRWLETNEADNNLLISYYRKQFAKPLDSSGRYIDAIKGLEDSLKRFSQLGKGKLGRTLTAAVRRAIGATQSYILLLEQIDLWMRQMAGLPSDQVVTLIFDDTRVGRSHNLSPAILVNILGPKLQALERLQHTLDEYQNREATVVAIKQISQHSPISVDILGIAELIKILPDLFGWRKDHAKRRSEAEISKLEQENLEKAAEVESKREGNKAAAEKHKIEMQRQEIEIARASIALEKERLEALEKLIEIIKPESADEKFDLIQKLSPEFAALLSPEFRLIEVRSADDVGNA